MFHREGKHACCRDHSDNMWASGLGLRWAGGAWEKLSSNCFTDEDARVRVYQRAQTSHGHLCDIATTCPRNKPNRQIDAHHTFRPPPESPLTTTNSSPTHTHTTYKIMHTYICMHTHACTQTCAYTHACMHTHTPASLPTPMHTQPRAERRGGRKRNKMSAEEAREAGREPSPLQRSQQAPLCLMARAQSLDSTGHFSRLQVTSLFWAKRQETFDISFKQKP